MIDSDSLCRLPIKSKPARAPYQMRVPPIVVPVRDIRSRSSAPRSPGCTSCAGIFFPKSMMNRRTLPPSVIQAIYCFTVIFPSLRGQAQPSERCRRSGGLHFPIFHPKSRQGIFQVRKRGSVGGQKIFHSLGAVVREVEFNTLPREGGQAAAPTAPTCDGGPSALLSGLIF